MTSHPEPSLTTFLAAQDAFTARVQAVGPHDWRRPTPDSDWSVADLVAHLVDEHRWAVPLLHGLDLDTAAIVVDASRPVDVDGGVGADLAQAWLEAAAGSADAFSAADVQTRTVALSRGATSVSVYLSEMIFDLVVHAWDLGTALDFAEPLPDGVVAAAWGQVADAEDLSSSGLFDAPVSVPDDAPLIDRLVARTGRDPHAR